MDKIIFFTTLVLFPFGQIFKFGIFNLFDISVVLLSIITFFKKPKYPVWYKYFLYFLICCLFTLIANYHLFEFKGFLYLLRLCSYSMVAVYVSNFYNKKILLDNLLALSVFSAIFGWVQYLIWPDLTTLKYLGWDDHLLRMIGTFLDPTYLALVIVLGIVILIFKKNIELKANLLLYFLIISLAFTYSRISLLILSVLLLFKRKYLGLLIFGISLIFLPKMIGEGTNLTRTASGFNKLVNYKETISMFKESPIYGLGFNNICKARQVYLNDDGVESHSCNGSESSFLFVLTTTGVVGLILFVSFLIKIETNNLLNLSLFAIFIHSFFANSLFYPHIMFWLFSIIGVTNKSLK